MEITAVNTTSLPTVPGTVPTINASPTKVSLKAGTMPSVREAKAQVKEQKALDTTVDGGMYGQDKTPVSSPSSAPDNARTSDKAKTIPAKQGPPEAKAEGTGEQTGTPKAGKTKDDTLARLGKVEKARLEAERQAKAANEERTKAAAELSEVRQFLADAKKNPAQLKKLLDQSGLDMEHIAKAYLNDFKPTPEQEVLGKIEELEKKLSAADQAKQDEQSQLTQYRQVRAEETHVDGFLQGINQHIGSKGADDFELTVIKAAEPSSNPRFRNLASEDAWQIAEGLFAQTNKIPTPQQVAEALEAYYQSEADDQLNSLMKSKKMSNKVKGQNAGTDREKTSSTEVPSKTSTKTTVKRSVTLGSDAVRVNTSANPNRRESDKDKLARLIAEANTRMARK